MYAFRINCRARAFVFGTGTTALMPAAPVTDLSPGQVTPDHSVLWQVELEKVLAGAPAATERSLVGCLPLCRPARGRKGGR
ncbi:hypothetical protein Bra471DRAFT_01424 [Bradyrhizobium sp. WSM471]|nr:hypothetical protein Bra471DRAFT_01424 [Bradyrhizobium sp. WSM471]